MAGFVERVVIEVQARTQGAVKDLRGMGSEVQQTSGLFGKAKAGAAGLLDTMKGLVSGPTAIAAVGAAAVTAAVKLADGFTTAALAADDMANRTGLATDEASRWIAVADDIGISADAVAGAAQKMTQNMGKAPEKFAALGITAKDTNEAMLQAIAVLNATPEGAQRAALGAELFGKAWGTMAELIDMGAADVATALGEVSDAQIFDADEVAKAKRYREAMDTLNDAVSDLATEMGEELAPAIASVADALAALVDNPAIENTLGVLGAGVEAAAESLANLTDWNGPDPEAITQLENLEAVMGMLTLRAEELGQSGALSLEQFRAAMSDADHTAFEDMASDVVAYRDGLNLAGRAQAEWERSSRRAAGAVEDHADELEGLNERLDTMVDAARDALGVDVKLEDAYADLTDTLKDRTKATKDGSEAEGEATRATLKAAQDVGDAEVAKAQQMAAARGETLSTTQENDILAQSYRNLAKMLAPNDPLRARLEAYAEQLDNLPETAATKITADSSQAQAEVLALWRKLYDARIQADLLELRLRGGSVRSWLTGVESAPGMSTTTVTVNVPPTLNPSKVLAAVGAGNTRDGGLRRG